MHFNTKRWMSLFVAMILCLVLAACSTNAQTNTEAGRYFNLDYKQMGGFFASMSMDDYEYTKE